MPFSSAGLRLSDRQLQSTKPDPVLTPSAPSYTFDVYQRVKTVTNPLGQTTTYHYQHEGFSSDPLVHTREQPRWVQYPSGKLDAFLYDRDFRLIQDGKRGHGREKGASFSSQFWV